MSRCSLYSTNIRFYIEQDTGFHGQATLGYEQNTKGHIQKNFSDKENK